MNARTLPPTIRLELNVDLKYEIDPYGADFVCPVAPGAAPGLLLNSTPSR